MPGIYPFPELEDVVYGYLAALYGKVGRPITVGMIGTAMSRDVPGFVVKADVKDALDSLEDKALIKRVGGGYIILDLREALGKQLELGEVEPFTREFGETPEAHLDKVWDFRTELVKPEAGGKLGLYPTSHYFRDRLWTGLAQE